MIVWSGRGFLIVLVLIVSFIFATVIIPQPLATLSIALPLLTTAVLSWVYGRKWNDQEGKTLIDKNTGQEFQFKPKHSLFWIKMQYWAFPLGGAGLWFLYLTFL